MNKAQTISHCLNFKTLLGSNHYIFISTLRRGAGGKLWLDSIYELLFLYVGFLNDLMFISYKNYLLNFEKVE